MSSRFLCMKSSLTPFTLHHGSFVFGTKRLPSHTMHIMMLPRRNSNLKHIFIRRAENTLDELEDIKKLLNNVDKMDVFQLKVQINRFFVSGVEDQLSLELMRLHLKKTLLEEILKVENLKLKGKLNAIHDGYRPEYHTR